MELDTTNQQVTPAQNNTPEAIVNSPLPKQKGFVPIIIGVVILIIVLVGGFYYLGINRNEVKNETSNRSLTIDESSASNPTNTLTKKNPEDNQKKLYLFKSDGIYRVDLNGKEMMKVFDIKEEELALSTKGYSSKLSPDNKYIAYKGTSGGLDLAVKVIDLNNGKKVSQMVFGSADITDFVWSPDSKQIAMAVNLKNTDTNFISTVYLASIGTDNPPNATLFNAENIEITSLVWPNQDTLYYSRLSHAKETNKSVDIVSLDINSKSRKVKNITKWTSNDFWITTNAQNDTMLFYTYAGSAPQQNTIYQTYSLPSLTKYPANLNLPENIKGIDWHGQNIVGISLPYGSPDSSIILYDQQTGKNIQLLDMGPSGSFHSVNLMATEPYPILIVWSEFDQKNSVSAYDLVKLKAAREQGNIDGLLWKFDDVSSPVTN